MKNLTLFCLSILTLTAISCNKEERLSKKYTNQLARTWKWNGYQQYSNKASYNGMITYYQDTSIAIKLIDDITVEFMGVLFTRDHTASLGKNANPLLTYFGVTYDRYLRYDYAHDTVYFSMASGLTSSVEIIRLSGR